MRILYVVPLLLCGCVWPGIDKGSKPQPISVPPSQGAADITKKAHAKAASSAANKPVSISTNLTFKWINAAQEPISFFKLWQGPSSGNYTNHFDSTTTNTTIAVTSGNYFFAATAVATNNLESLPSGELAINVPFSKKPTGKPPKP